MDKNMLLVSVIMPAYNAQETLAQSIESVLSQSYTNFELIVIDDGSKDQTLQIAQRYAQVDKRVVVLSNAVNCGVSVSRHTAIAHAKGNWLAFLDSDDLWASDKLEKQVLLQQQKEAKLVFTGSAFMDADGRRLDYHMSIPAEIRYKQLLKQNLISNSSVLVEKACYQKFEVLGSNNMHEDFACWLSILHSGITAYGLNKPLLIYRLSPTSKSGNKAHSAAMNWNTYRKIGISIPRSIYYMGHYAINGLRKYGALRRSLRRYT